jgi:hypothetical protein
MNRTWILALVMLCPLLALAQNSQPPYQPAVPAASVNSNSGWPGYSSGGQTPAGAALNGMSNVIAAQGQRNLANSAAAVNMTQAQKNEIENHQLYANTYWQMRDAWRAQRDAQRGPPPTMEQMARNARNGTPKPLTPNEIDAVSGKLNWPSVLLQDSFATQRDEVDQMFVKWAQYGTLGYSEQTKLREDINAMLDQLNAQIKDMPQQAWAEARRFLRSVIYAATKGDLQG